MKHILANKGNKDVKYRYVDNINIYKFIEEIKALPNNNNIKGFESADDIINYLKEQFAGLFKQFLIDSRKMKETLVIKDIENTAKNLRSLVDYLKQENQEKGADINKIIMFNHPIIRRLKEILHINHNFYFEGIADFENFLTSFGCRKRDKSWIKEYGNGTLYISFSNKLFESDGKLKYFKQNEWKDEYVSSKFIENHPPVEDLPF